MAIISICRGSKSGGRALAECLAAHLDYPILGKEVVEEAAERLGVSASEMEQKMFGRPTLRDRFSTLRRAYIAAIQAELAEQMIEGKLVYHGLAGGFLLREAPCSLCLRLIAPMERRVAVVAEESGMEPDMAANYIREVDESRARWVRVMYGEDIADPAIYDLVVNLDVIDVQGACALTRAAVSGPEFRIDERARRKLEDFRIASRVRLALAEDQEVRALDLEAAAEDGVVTVTGEAPLLRSGRMGRTIADIPRNVPGVLEVRLEVEWFDPYP